MRLQGLTALVTGAGGGFGAAMARRFAIEGATVICADIDHAAAREVAGSFGATQRSGVPVACDVSDGESVRAMIGTVVEQCGGFDVLVNNAALTQKPSRLARIGEAELDRLLAVNIKSLYHMSVHALPVLRQRGGGSVINIASVAAMRPRPGMAWYNATKAAVICLTQTMAAELAPDRIRVNAIAPAAGRTSMLASMFGAEIDAGVDRVLSTIPLGRLCEPEDVASAAVYLASADAAFVTGVVLPVDGGRLVG